MSTDVTAQLDWLAGQATQRAGLTVEQAAQVAPVLVAAMLAGAGHKSKDDGVRQLVAAALPAARRLLRRYRRAQKAIDLSGLPDVLKWLIGQLADLLRGLFADLADGELAVDEWLSEFRQALAEYHAAAWMAGSGQMALAPDEVTKVTHLVEAQLAFLDDFKAEVQGAEAFKAGWQARAESYANSIKQPYWQGKTNVLPLPAMPGQGTQCLGNCRCLWDIKPLDAKKGDFDCYWRLESGAEHCQTCLQRAKEWKPLKIRDFKLVLP